MAACAVVDCLNTRSSAVDRFTLLMPFCSSQVLLLCFMQSAPSQTSSSTPFPFAYFSPSPPCFCLHGPQWLVFLTGFYWRINVCTPCLGRLIPRSLSAIFETATLAVQFGFMSPHSLCFYLKPMFNVHSFAKLMI